jgi:hypothetical protein
MPVGGFLRADFFGSILEERAATPGTPAELLFGSYTRMPSEPLPDTPTPAEGQDECKSSEEAELPVNLSEFTQRLASFGLGESPDPLLTDTRPPLKRRVQD